MSEPQAPQTPAPADEKPGEIIRKAREGRGIGIDAVARALKLNRRVIEALEAGRWSEFSAPPYVRVYLRGVARHLGLDATMLVKLYERETGAAAEPSTQELTRVSVKNDKAADSATPWLAILGLLAAAALIAFAANRMHLAPTSGGATGTPPAADTVVAPAEVFDADTTAADAAAPADTATVGTTDSTAGRGDTSTARLAPAAVAPPTVKPLSKPVPAAKPTDSASTAPEARADTAQPRKGGQLRLVINARRDSVWVQVFSDGKSTRSYIKAGRPWAFKAKDSLVVHVGQNANLLYTLNDKPYRPSDIEGAAIFRVDHSGTTLLTLEQWKATTAAQQ